MFCHLGGLFSVFLGIIVIFIDLLNNDLTHIQVGLYIFVSGYALVKIAAKISDILISERYWFGEGKAVPQEKQKIPP